MLTSSPANTLEGPEAVGASLKTSSRATRNLIWAMQRRASTAKCHHRVATVVTDGGRQITGQTDVTVMEAGPGRTGRLTTTWLVARILVQ